MAEGEKDYTISNHVEDQREEDARSTANNAQNIRNAADVAMATKNPYAVAAGAAVKAADKVTGGKSTEALGKVMTKANKHAPGGRRLQKASNKVNESGIGDKVGQAARMKNKYGGGGGSGQAGQAAQAGQAGSQAAGKAGGQASLPSSAGQNASSAADKTKKVADNIPEKSSKDNSDDGEKKGGIGQFLLKRVVITMALTFLPFIVIIMLFVAAIATVTGLFSDYEDAFGMSQVLGEETGGLYFTASTQEQKDFYERVNDVKLAYQAQGMNVDAMQIIALYHVLKTNGADIDYEDMDEWTIREWADAMFDENVYDEETFKNNIINNIIPKYLPGKSQAQREEMANEVMSYIERYNNLIGKTDNTGSCASIGSCTYDIKGFYYSGHNVAKNMQISNLKVRLMQCGSPYGNGSYSKPIANQDLVDFEDYVAGVAYAEVGDGAPIEQYKAQMVAARSFALSRPTAMGNSLGKKLEKENGQWVLQISSCVADQVFCHIDEGCHTTGGSQGGYIVNGKGSNGYWKGPLSEDNDLRRAAAATQGEVLVNKQGYIIAAGYLNTEQNLWRSLANKGMNYKQILLQTYNQGGRNYGATEIKKASCNADGSSCVSNGEYSSWRQYDSEWGGVEMGGSGETIKQIGCLVTSVAIQIAKSGVETKVNPFNPGSFVKYLNSHGGFAGGGNFVWASTSTVAPKFVFKNKISVSSMSRNQKLKKIKELTSQNGIYVVAEVMGNTGQHWVAIDSVNGSTVNMIDPASDETSLWSKYNWANTSTLAYFKAG